MEDGPFLPEFLKRGNEQYIVKNSSEVNFSNSSVLDGEVKSRTVMRATRQKWLYRMLNSGIICS